MLVYQRVSVGDPLVPPSQETYSLTLAACRAVGCWEVTLEILDAARERDLTLSSGDLKNAMACCKSHSWQHALELLEELRGRGEANMLQYISICFSGAVVTQGLYTSVISALGEAQQLQRAQELYEEMQRKLLGISDAAEKLSRLNAELQQYLMSQDWSGALHLWRQLREEKTWQLDTETAQKLAIACDPWLTQSQIWAKTGQWQQALQLSDFPQALPSITRTCAESKQWEHALEMLQKMNQMALQVDPQTYHAVVRACASAGRLEEAESVFQDMKRQGHEPLLGGFSWWLGRGPRR
eukprot:s5091_g1.t1